MTLKIPEHEVNRHPYVITHRATGSFHNSPVQRKIHVQPEAVILLILLILTSFLHQISPAQNRGERVRQPRAPRASSTPRTEDRWYVFTSPDKDFVIQFPSKPERRADDEAPSGTSRNYVLIREDLVFQLTFMDTGLERRSREGNQLPLGFRQEMLDQAKKRGWTVIRSELLRVNVYEQETWSPTKRDPSRKLHYIERNVVRYGRQYILTCSSITPDRRVNVALCKRFFNSFRVVGEPRPQ
jgi:hypothetical protein